MNQSYRNGRLTLLMLILSNVCIFKPIESVGQFFRGNLYGVYFLKIKFSACDESNTLQQWEINEEVVLWCSNILYFFLFSPSLFSVLAQHLYSSSHVTKNSRKIIKVPFQCLDLVKQKTYKCAINWHLVFLSKPTYIVSSLSRASSNNNQRLLRYYNYIN